MRKTALDMVHELARSDGRVVFIGSDLGAGTLDAMRAEMPDRFFMEGVAEQNIVGMAAGMAMDGLVPFVNTIATFLTRRCYEQVAVDLCMHDLPVKLIANGGGLVYAPLGPTHLAIEDIAILRALPRMTVLAPCDAEEMKRLVPATMALKGPCYIRLAKGGDRVVSDPACGFEIGRGIVMRPPGAVLLVTTGIATTQALEAAALLGDAGIAAGVLHMHTVKPLDAETLVAAARHVDAVVTVEEHSVVGGLGSAVTDVLTTACGRSLPALVRLGIPDRFPDRYGSQEELLTYFGLDADGIAASVMAVLAGREMAA